MTRRRSIDAARWTWLVGVAIVFAGLTGCSRKEEAPTAASSAPSAAAALDPLIQQYVDIEKHDEEESGGLRDVSAAGFQQDIEVRRQLLDKVRQVSKDGLSTEEDIDRRLMIGLLERAASGKTILRCMYPHLRLAVASSRPRRARRRSARLR